MTVTAIRNGVKRTISGQKFTLSAVASNKTVAEKAEGYGEAKSYCKTDYKEQEITR